MLVRLPGQAAQEGQEASLADPGPDSLSRVVPFCWWQLECPLLLVAVGATVSTPPHVLELLERGPICF